MNECNDCDDGVISNYIRKAAHASDVAILEILEPGGRLRPATIVATISEEAKSAQ